MQQPSAGLGVFRVGKRAWLQRGKEVFLALTVLFRWPSISACWQKDKTERHEDKKEGRKERRKEGRVTDKKSGRKEDRKKGRKEERNTKRNDYTNASTARRLNYWKNTITGTRKIG